MARSAPTKLKILQFRDFCLQFVKAIISADASMDQVKVQGAVKSQMEGKAGVLKAEIKQDAGRGDVEKKKEELAAVEAKAQDIEASQMSAIYRFLRIICRTAWILVHQSRLEIMWM